MKRFSFVLWTAFATALLISWAWEPIPYEERLIRLQVEELLPEYAAELHDEPVDLQAVFIDYTDDPLLVAKARLALLRYPEMARPILLLYGADADFQAGLRDYGDNVIPPIHYFISHDVRTVKWMKEAGETMRSVEAEGRRLWTGEPKEFAAGREPRSEMTPEERGRYAVLFIRDEGHSFLGQFVVGSDGEVSWVQSARLMEAANVFFFGGIRSLETKYRLDQPIELTDIGGAAIDVAVGVGVLKVLRMGRSAKVAGRSLSFSERTLALSPALLRGSAVGLRLVKYGAPLAVGYLALRHPSVLHSLLGQLAEIAGVPVRLGQLIGWTLVLLPVLYLGCCLLRPLAAVLVGLSHGLRWLTARH